VKIGDVVHDAVSFHPRGLVIKQSSDAEFFLVAYLHGPVLWEHINIETRGVVRRMSDSERAIVNAAIAAEALRRMK